MNNSYFNKYLKYKTLYFNLKKQQKGGSYNDIEWFELRKFVNFPKVEYNVPDFLERFNNGFLARGGQSSIYNFKNNPYLLIRTIDNPNIQNELYVINIVSKFIVEDINPHFVNSPYIKDNIHVMERFDGDISNIDVDYNIHFQLLVGFISLINNGVLFTDIKKENILYKRLNTPVILRYNINGNIYKLYTNIIVAFTDYGNAYKYNDKMDEYRITSFVQFIKVVTNKDVKTSEDFKAYLYPAECSELMDIMQVKKFLLNIKIIRCLVTKLHSIYQDPWITDGIPETQLFNVLNKI
jgi:hypothetical protein